MIDHWRESNFLTASDKDMDVYESMLPEDHKLCQLFDTVDFEAFRPIVESAYSAKGQPTGYAMIAFKLEILKYYYNLSDRAVISRANTDVAFRWFLRIPIRYMFKDHTFLTLFRGRLGKERYEQLFQALVAQARKSGLVKDQLRLKDATHVLADISIPSTLALVSQIRDRLVKLIFQIDAEAAAGYEQAIECMRGRTKDADDTIRLHERVELLGDIVGCAKTLLERADELPSKIKADLQDSIDLADKILAQRQEKKAKRQIRSVVDPDAMRGKHGAYYDGYTLDVCMDADSELITAINVLQAGGNEAESAITLIEQERSSQGNAPREISIDGAGFHGPMIRTLEDDMGMQVYTPPKKLSSQTEIGSERFEVIESPDGTSKVRCPQGHESRYVQRDRECTVYRFPKDVCQSCPLYQACCGTVEQPSFGRTVRKNDHQDEYDRVRSRSKTDRFKEVRSQHPAIERKLNECVNVHGARNSRYRGLDKVPIQMFGIGMAINMKRIAKLMLKRITASPRKWNVSMASN